MQSKILSRQVMSEAVFVGLIFFSLVLFFYFNPISIIQSAPTVTSKDTYLNAKQQTNSGLPVRLIVPSINLDSVIEHVGLTSRGAVDTPRDFAKVAWFSPWPRPGEKGNAIIVGHYGKKNGKASVFDNLYKLHKGDKLYVQDDAGVIVSFVVRDIRKYNPRAVARDVFISNDDKSHLNLITCEGVWDRFLKSYSKRLVIFTDKE